MLVFIIGLAFLKLLIFYYVASRKNSRKQKLNEFLVIREHGMVEDPGVLINTKIDQDFEHILVDMS